MIGTIQWLPFCQSSHLYQKTSLTVKNDDFDSSRGSNHRSGSSSLLIAIVCMITVAKLKPEMTRRTINKHISQEINTEGRQIRWNGPHLHLGLVLLGGTALKFHGEN